MDELKNLIDQNISSMNLWVDNIFIKDNVLNVVLDSNDIINVDMIVKATKIINPIVDKKDIMKDSYVLDVYSKEKGVEE